MHAALDLTRRVRVRDLGGADGDPPRLRHRRHRDPGGHHRARRRDPPRPHPRYAAARVHPVGVPRRAARRGRCRVVAHPGIARLMRPLLVFDAAGLGLFSWPEPSRRSTTASRRSRRPPSGSRPPSGGGVLRDVIARETRRSSARTPSSTQCRRSQAPSWSPSPGSSTPTARRRSRRRRGRLRRPCARPPPPLARTPRLEALGVAALGAFAIGCLTLGARTATIDIDAAAGARRDPWPRRP